MSSAASCDPLLGAIGDIIMTSLPDDTDDLLTQLCADIDEEEASNASPPVTLHHLPASPPWSSSGGDDDEEEARLMDLESAISLQMREEGNTLFRVEVDEGGEEDKQSLSRLALSPPSSLLEGEAEENGVVGVVVAPGHIQISDSSAASLAVAALLTTGNPNRDDESPPPPSICSPINVSVSDNQDGRERSGRQMEFSPTDAASSLANGRCHLQDESGRTQIKEESEDGPMSHCGVCKLVFSSSISLELHRMEGLRTLCCCQCGKRFVSASKLACHQRKHSKEKPFRCNSCGKHYTHRTTLARHQLHYCQALRAKREDDSHAANDLLVRQLDEEHLPVFSDAVDEQYRGTVKCHHAVGTEGAASKCNVCSAELGSAAALAEHRESFLSARTCCACNKTLGNRSKLLTHHRSHTKESPFACAFCGKRFAESSTLRKHEATHGARNFQCGVCGRGFVRKDYLDKHALTHRQTYRCAQCKFVCYGRVEMEAHVKIH